MMAVKKTGTKEWAETNVNIQLGCEHGCRYCYARYNAVNRFKWCTAEQWLDPVIDQSKVKRSFLKRPGVVMFPSTHDITQRNLSECICVLNKLLDSGNRILLVSKPSMICIEVVCYLFKEYKSQLMFRFTIGSMDDQVLSFWEPDAPIFQERMACLRHAYKNRYRTSVSCEPFLDCNVNKIVGLYEFVKPYITDSFWIGKLREFDKRVVLADIKAGEKETFVEPLKATQADDGVIFQIYEQLFRERLVRWKDSIREIIEK